MNDFLAEIRTNPQFMAIIEKVKKARPDLPKYNPAEDNTEGWKYISAKQEGIDLALKLLGE